MRRIVKIIWLIIKVVGKKNMRNEENQLLKTLQSTTMKKSFTFLKNVKDFKSKGTYTAL